MNQHRPPVKLNDRIHRNDVYCFECHQPNDVIECQICPRVYHRLCARLSSISVSNWICPECESIQSSFHTINRNYSSKQLIIMLRHILNRLKCHSQAEYLLNWKYPSDINDYIIHPMNFDLIEQTLNKKQYSSTDSFLRDIKWIVHNTSIYNGSQHKLTQTARAFLKITQNEIYEIELCSECYIRRIQASTEDWFIKPCSIPHTLCWAKMKGYEPWPAKVLRIVNDEVEVYFFGKHYRAKIAHSHCFVLSKHYPGKRSNGQLEKSMLELNEHIEELKRIYGDFFYASQRTVLSRIKPFRFVPTINDSNLPSYMTSSYQISRKRSRNFDDDDELQSSVNVFDILNESERTRSISPTDNKYRIQTLIKKYVQSPSNNIIINPDVRTLMNDLLCSLEKQQQTTLNSNRIKNSSNTFPTCSTLPFVSLRPLSINPLPTVDLVIKSEDEQSENVTQSSITIETNPISSDDSQQVNVWPSILSIESPKKKSKHTKTKQQDFLPTISHDELRFDHRSIRDEIQTKIHHFQTQFQLLLVNFTNEIDSTLRASQAKYEEDLTELHSITTEQVQSIRHNLELQYCKRLSEIRNRYESKFHYSHSLRFN